MGVRLVNPESLTKPVGYAHAAVGTGRTIVLAGQIGCDRTGRVVEPQDLVKQFARALDNLLVALRAAGGEPAHLAQLRIFTTDVAEYRARRAELGKAWKERFGSHYPAMVLVGVSQLYEPGSKVEVEGLAYAD
jgi:enamine deaminase RidA (YjgF/YER057c/UK114 family)